jgi:hypothetical protein
MNVETQRPRRTSSTSIPQRLWEPLGWQERPARKARRRRPGAALALAPLAAIALTACGGSSAPPPPPPAQLADPLRLTGPSPYPAGCNPPAAGAVVYLGAEVEPSLAGAPDHPAHLVAAWQQDRWRDGGADGLGAAASFDGGSTWTRSDLPFTICAGGQAGLAWQRASDPWVAILPDGTALALGLALDDPWYGTGSAILASRSADGGRTWAAPAELASEASTDLQLDKCSLTADPTRPGTAYAVWDRLTGLDGPASLATGPAWISRTTDGGASWAPPWILYDPLADAQTISSQVVVQPDGALVNLLVLIRGLGAASPSTEVAVLRSIDAGTSWTGPFTVSAWQEAGLVDPLGRTAIRAGDLVPAVAVDPGTGALYAAWQDGRFAGGLAAIAFSRSLDGGASWSPPARVNGDPSAPAFTPSLAVARSGRVGLGYYDWRIQPAGSGPGLWTTRWLATSLDGGATWSEAPDGGPFDLRRAPAVPGYFLGDYAGLAAGADGFTSLFAMTLFGGGAERTDLYLGGTPR